MVYPTMIDINSLIQPSPNGPFAIFGVFNMPIHLGFIPFLWSVVCLKYPALLSLRFLFLQQTIPIAAMHIAAKSNHLN